MRIYIDIDTRRILTTATRPATRLEFKRRDNDAFEVQFLRAGAVQSLPVGTIARVGVKASADFAGEFLATDTLSVTGTGADTVYRGAFNLNTTALEALFPEEPASITAMLEVQWVSGTSVGSSLTLPITIFNDVIRGDEGAPADLPIFYTSSTSNFLATQAEAEAGSDNTKWMSPLRVAQAIEELGGGGGVSSWNDLTDKPSTFPPATHTHAIADTTGLQGALDGKATTSHTHPLSALTQSSATSGQVVTWNGTAWVPQTPSGGGGGVPDAHMHEIVDIYDLQDTIDGKAETSHTHAATDITSGTLALARIPTGTTSSTVALGNHTHALSDTSGLQPALDGKAATSHTHGNITNAGAIGTTATLPIITGASGVLAAGSFGTTAGTFAQGNHTHTTLAMTTLQVSGEASFGLPVETKAAPTISGGALTLNLATATFFTVTINANSTVAFSNPPASPKVFSFTLQTTGNGTAYATTWPAAVKWANGISPAITTLNGKIDAFTFVTHDGGTTWLGFVSGQNF
jgi:hypothetical protein